MSVFVCGLATMKTEPPGPPSPPLGPPRGTNFSRLNAMAPRPPCPAATWMSTSSTTTTGTRGQPGALRTSRALAFQRNDADHASAGAVILELDRAIDFREQRVVLAETDVQAGPELAAALPNQNRPAGDNVAVVPLDAETLRVAVAAVT